MIATPQSATQVSLQWQPASDNVAVTGYQIYRDGAPVAVATAPAYVDGAVAAATWYTYAVAATDAAGNVSARSAAVSVLTPPPADLTAPTISGAAASAVTENAATLTWQTDEPAVSLVEYGLTTSYGLQSPWSASWGTAQAVTVAGLSPGNSYHYRAVSRDKTGNQARTQDLLLRTVAAATPDRTPPPAVADLTISDVEQSSLVLTWTAPPDGGGIVGYDIRYGMTPLTAQNFSTALRVQAAPLPAALGARQSQYISVGLTPGVTYYFAISATDAAGNVSALSNVPSATMRDAPATTSATPSAQPGTLSVPMLSADGTVVGYTVYQLADATAPASPSQVVAQGTDAQVTLRWVNPTDPDFVRVQIARTLSAVAVSPSGGLIIYEGRDETFTDLSAKNGVTYTYTVSAFDRSGNFAPPVYVRVAPLAGVTQVNAPVVAGVTAGGSKTAWLVVSVKRRELYVIFPDGTRRRVSSLALAKRLGLPVERAVPLDDRVLAAYPLGAPLTDADTNLLEILDTDGDALTDAWEQRLGTDAGWADTDGDGFPDGDEWISGRDPLYSFADAPPDPALRRRVRGRFVLAESGGNPLYYVTPTAQRRIPLPDESTVWRLVLRQGRPVAHATVAALPPVGRAAAPTASGWDGWLLVDISDGRAYYVFAGRRYALSPGQVTSALRPLTLRLPRAQIAALSYQRLAP